MKEIKYDIYKRLKVMEVESYEESPKDTYNQMNVLRLAVSPITTKPRNEVHRDLVEVSDRIEAYMLMNYRYDFDQRVIRWTDISNVILPIKNLVSQELENKTHLI